MNTKKFNFSASAKLALFAILFIIAGKTSAQCSPAGSFDIKNNLSCNVEVWIEVADCNVPGSITGWWASIPAGGIYNVTLTASDNIDVILQNVGGTNIPAGSFNSYNPCNPPQTCLPGTPTGNSGVTGDPICPTYNMMTSTNGCDINP